MNAAELDKAIAQLKEAIDERFERAHKEIMIAVQKEIENQMMNINANFAGNMSVTHKQPEPDKFTKLSNYVHLLLSAHNVGHSVNREINEAFEELKEMALEK